ncbi:glycosyltransferase family 25 protein [Bradyrhizobium japonicum]|uniref:glycosyltransferase family 25 protein n=1 Tax=Bradyrhizobium japonicum TaxID=375 RepID=UPI0004A3F8D7|nr:glycosyltransferase family 25 protein [Bradyrhizobium japonicum]
MKVVINLPERNDRRREIQKELSRIGWEAIFLPAVKPPDAGTFPSIGARGCFLSHLEALERALRLNAPELYLLEDDLNFDINFLAQWASIKSELDQKEWSMFYPAPVKPTTTGLVEAEPTTPIPCTHFLLVNGSTIPILVARLHEILANRPMHVDGAYNTIRAELPSVRTFCHWPPLGYQRSSRSDITPGRFDRHRFSSQVLSLARRVKNRLRGP